MPIYRFYHDAKLTGEVFLEGVEHRHLTQVVRVREGDTVELFNGKGDLASATVTTLDKKAARLSIIELRHEAQSEHLILAQGLPLINRLDFILEKCTELGIREMRLFAGDLSERKSLTDHQLDRLRQLTIAACKQSGRLWLPELKWIDPISKWKTPIPDGIYGDPNPDSTPLLKLQKAPVFVCIGPESGLSRDEKRKLFGLGVKSCTWNEAVLRTDTAAISAAAIINAMRVL